MSKRPVITPDQADSYLDSINSAFTSTMPTPMLMQKPGEKNFFVVPDAVSGASSLLCDIFGGRAAPGLGETCPESDAVADQAALRAQLGQMQQVETDDLTIADRVKRMRAFKKEINRTLGWTAYRKDEFYNRDRKHSSSLNEASCILDGLYLQNLSEKLGDLVAGSPGLAVGTASSKLSATAREVVKLTAKALEPWGVDTCKALSTTGSASCKTGDKYMAWMKRNADTVNWKRSCAPYDATKIAKGRTPFASTMPNHSGKPSDVEVNREVVDDLTQWMLMDKSEHRRQQTSAAPQRSPAVITESTEAPVVSYNTLSSRGLSKKHAFATAMSKSGGKNKGPESRRKRTIIEYPAIAPSSTAASKSSATAPAQVSSSSSQVRSESRPLSGESFDDMVKRLVTEYLSPTTHEGRKAQIAEEFNFNPDIDFP